MSLTKECCTRPVINSDYEGIGTEFKLNDLLIYQTGDITSKRVLISVHDIFGFHPNLKQFSDEIAKDGFLVATPNFFREGSPWDPSNFPPKDLQEVRDWIGKVGLWSIVEPDIRRVIDHYKSQGVTVFGMFGFCWGGKVSVQAAAVMSDELKGVGLIHPAMITEEDAKAIKCPVIFVLSKDEEDMVPFQENVQKRLGVDAAEHFRYDDMQHGYAGARGDFKNELNKQRVDETIDKVSTFFNKHMKE